MISDPNDPVATFNAKVDAEMGRGKNRAQAIFAVIQANGDLHERFLNAVTEDAAQLRRANRHLQPQPM